MVSSKSAQSYTKIIKSLEKTMTTQKKKFLRKLLKICWKFSEFENMNEICITTFNLSQKFYYSIKVESQILNLSCISELIPQDKNHLHQKPVFLKTIFLFIEFLIFYHLVHDFLVNLFRLGTTEKHLNQKIFSYSQGASYEYKIASCLSLENFSSCLESQKSWKDFPPNKQ